MKLAILFTLFFISTLSQPPLTSTGPDVFLYFIGTIVPTIGPSKAIISLHLTSTIAGTIYDAQTPYHDLAEAISFNTSAIRRSSEEHTATNRNTALAYAVLEIMDLMHNEGYDETAAAVSGLGLDPDLDSEDLSTAEGIGRYAAQQFYDLAINDGMNRNGDYLRQVNRKPYEDWTNYYPVNAPWPTPNPDPTLLNDINRWVPLRWDQPNTGPRNSQLGGPFFGQFGSQSLILPQWFKRSIFSNGLNVSTLVTPGPYKFHPGNPYSVQNQYFVNQVKSILNISAGLTDEQKMIAEFYDDKFVGYGFPFVFLAIVRGQNLFEFSWSDAVRELAFQDGAAAVWYQKRKYDSVRPESAVHFLYMNKNVTAWAGTGQGTQTFRGLDWRPYLPTDFHQDYPSGSMCFCTIQSELMRLIFGDDDFGYSVTFPAGSSVREPGVTPASNVTLYFATHTEWEEKCYMSRQYGGVHFKKAMDDSRTLCTGIALKAYNTMQKHLNGTITAAQKMQKVPKPGYGGVNIGNPAGPPQGNGQRPL